MTTRNANRSVADDFNDGAAVPDRRDGVASPFSARRYEGLDPAEQEDAPERVKTTLMGAARSKDTYHRWSETIGYLHQMKAARRAMGEALLKNRVAVELFEEYCAKKLAWFDAAKNTTKNQGDDFVYEPTEAEIERLKEWGPVIEVMRQTVLALVKMQPAEATEDNKAEILKRMMIKDVPALDLERDILCVLEQKLADRIKEQAEIKAELKSRHGSRKHRKTLGDEHGKKEREIKRLEKGISAAREAFGAFIDARNAFVELNRAPIERTAKNYAGLGVDVEDLVQESIQWLTRHIEFFDPDSSEKISTFVTPSISRIVEHIIDNQSRTMRIPVHSCEEIREMEKAARNLRQEWAREPLQEEIARRMDIPLSKVQKIQGHARDVVYINPIEELDNDPALARALIDVSQENPYQQAVTRALQEEIQRALFTLNPRQQIALQMRLGLKGYRSGYGDEHTLDEVAENFGVSRERIRQIEAKALRSMLHPPRSRKLRSFLEGRDEGVGPGRVVAVQAHENEPYVSVPLTRDEYNKIYGIREPVSAAGSRVCDGLDLVTWEPAAYALDAPD